MSKLVRVSDSTYVGLNIAQHVASLRCGHNHSMSETVDWLVCMVAAADDELRVQLEREPFQKIKASLPAEEQYAHPLCARDHHNQ
jgi:hypothetical protein